jgi:hypothetical protein
MDNTQKTNDENAELQVSNEQAQLPVKVETVIDASAGALIDILKDNIEKIRKDKNYIPQAQEVANQVDKIIQIGKTQIEGMRVAASMLKK